MEKWKKPFLIESPSLPFSLDTHSKWAADKRVISVQSGKCRGRRGKKKTIYAMFFNPGWRRCSRGCNTCRALLSADRQARQEEREGGRHVGRPQIAGERLLSTCVTDFSCHQNSLTLRMTKVKEKKNKEEKERARESMVCFQGERERGREGNALTLARLCCKSKNVDWTRKIQTHRERDRGRERHILHLSRAIFVCLPGCVCLPHLLPSSKVFDKWLSAAGEAQL